MYQHTVQYYETDRMGITHHSNYIRWMEEARVHFQKEIGYSYERMEAEGIVSPVISVDCEYKKTTTFADVVNIELKIEEFNGVKLKIAYTMTNEKGQVVCKAHSGHCFLNAEGRPIRLHKEFPDFYEMLKKMVEE